MVKMHPLTLHFDDPRAENELCAERLSMASNLLYLCGAIAVAFEWHLPNFLINQSVAVITTLLCVYFASSSHEKLSQMWVFGWAVNSGVWWVMLWNGTLRRFRADEDILAPCGIYFGMALVQRMLHIRARHRAATFAVVLAMILSSTYFRNQLLGALALGEVSGYIIERMLRDTFLRRVEVREMLREAEAHVANVEHIRREQLIAQRLRARPRRAANRSTSASRASRGSSPGQLEPIASEKDSDSSGRSTRSSRSH